MAGDKLFDDILRTPEEVTRDYMANAAASNAELAAKGVGLIPRIRYQKQLKQQYQQDLNDSQLFTQLQRRVREKLIEVGPEKVGKNPEQMAQFAAATAIEMNMPMRLVNQVLLRGQAVKALTLDNELKQAQIEAHRAKAGLDEAKADLESAGGSAKSPVGKIIHDLNTWESVEQKAKSAGIRNPAATRAISSLKESLAKTLREDTTFKERTLEPFFQSIAKGVLPDEPQMNLVAAWIYVNKESNDPLSALIGAQMEKETGTLRDRLQKVMESMNLVPPRSTPKSGEKAAPASSGAAKGGKQAGTVEVRRKSDKKKFTIPREQLNDVLLSGRFEQVK